MIDITGLREDKRPQSSIIVRALLDRLEAAEAEALEQARLNGMGSEREAALMAKLEAAERERDECNRRRLEAADHFAAQTALMKKKCDALRAKIEQMERQEPVATTGGMPGTTGFTMACFHADKVPIGSKLYTLPGAQNAPVEQDESVRKAWSRFSNELHRSPDAPYPGMSEAFEQHFSQSFTDRDWRAESGTWAAAWKAAKRHCGQPAPSVPDGWKLVPIEPTEDMLRAMTDPFVAINGDNRKAFESAYTAMLAAAQEAKP